MDLQARGGTVAIYLRGARQEEQLALCREYAMLQFGLTESDHFRVFRDDGGLGDEMLPGRLELEHTAKSGELGAVVCADVSVLCRSTAELLETVRYFDGLGAAVMIASERLDTAAPLGRMLLYTAEHMLQLERKTAASNIRDNMRALARTGRWLGGVTPTGYSSRRVSSGAGSERAYQLEVHPGQAKTVRLIFSLFLEHDSLSKVTQELAGGGVSTKNGRAFSRFTVRQILENPVYMRADPDAFSYFTRLGAEVCSPQSAFDGAHGMMVYNKTAQQQGLPTQQRDVSEWIVAVGEHEGLIGAADWIAAQHQLSRNKSKTARKPKSDHGLLAELLYCADCGAHMRPKLTQRVDKAGEPVFAYLCERKETSRSSECDMPNLMGGLTDAAVVGFLSSLDPDEPDLFPATPERPATPEALAAHEARMQTKREQIAQNEEGISRLVFSLIKAIDKSAYDEIIKQIDQFHTRNANLRAELDAMEALTGPHPMREKYNDGLRELLRNWSKYYPEMSISRRRAALRALVESIAWDGQELLVKFSGGAEFAIKPY